MLGTALLGTTLLGTGDIWTTATFSGRLSYNDFEFGTSTIKISNISDIENLPSYSRTTFKTARVHGEGHTSFFYDRKQLTVTGVIESSSASELVDTIKSMKQALAKEQQQLKLNKLNSDLITTTATVVDFKIDRKPSTVTVVSYTIVFETLEPFRYGNSLIEASYTGKSASFSSSIDNTYGNYKALPQVLISFLSGLSSVTSIAVTIGSDTLTVTGSFTNSDAILIDSNTKDVYKNDVGGQNYTGSFGELEIGSNTVTVTINGTWNADIYFLRYPTHV